MLETSHEAQSCERAASKVTCGSDSNFTALQNGSKELGIAINRMTNGTQEGWKIACRQNDEQQQKKTEQLVSKSE